jgi:hypothetical protein
MARDDLCGIYAKAPVGYWFACVQNREANIGKSEGKTPLDHPSSLA